ncbi:MAG: putative ATPase, partial [Gammaproteobacteria bacterium]|nr:putative ATPase [Gammaproteobacteria bacterium]
MNVLLSTLLEEFQSKITNITGLVEREVALPNIPNKIIVAIGMRRTGKSHFLLQTIEQLLQQDQVALSRILYIDFEDDRLTPLTTQQLSELLDSFYTLYPENHDQLCYLFLDEIQNVENWQMVIRRYFDTKKVKIYLTGSSAKLLSKEIATSLRGRSIATEIWPFSFTEYLQAKGISLPKTYGQKNLDKLNSWLRRYIKEGGFPETIGIFSQQIATIWAETLDLSSAALDQHFFDSGGDSSSATKLTRKIKELGLNLSIDDLLQNPTFNQFSNHINNIYSNTENRRYILQNYLNSVVLRDIVERYKVTNITLVRYIVKFLLKNVGCGFSANTLFNDVKSQGIAVSKTTIHDYLGHIEDAYLAFTVPLYSESLRKTHSNPRKIYAVDTGLVNACTFGFSENIGHQFENLIYLDLRRAKHEIYYYLTTTRKEVDFLTQDPHGKRHLFQVCWDMRNAETQERELSALHEAERELKIKGECITPATYFTSFLPTIQK